MPKEFSRTERLGEQIKRELALLIQREMKDPRVGMVTINEVVVTKDLAYAKVYVTVLTTEDAIEKSIKILNGAAGFLRTQLGSRIRARTVPELTFIYDKTMIEGNRLAKIIDELKDLDGE